ncbi:MAG: glycine dehydrogenase (aminomethyl-transferring) [Desulfurococcales archaeon ex4484_217_2]|nr:MAG: glycine dehydrogenase (aminomethyl-transferring) [Desulfurococcales archaeon ex4484_217_2]
MVFRQAKWDEPLIYELGAPGRIGFLVPEVEEEIKKEVGEIKVPDKIKRSEPPALPEISEVEVVRHFVDLSQMAYGIDNGPVPLGSCTMKYNPKIAFEVANDPRVAYLHPLQDERTVQGLLEALYHLQKWLANIVGMDACTLNPAAGAHGELTGVLLIRKYHELKGQLDKKTEIIIPDSAHGTNPASAAMAGFRVITVRSDADGNVDIEALKAAVSEKTAGLMLTNPSTLGLFEEHILEIAEILHEVDALLYYDGANLNGIMGYARPGDMGFDIAHINIHKTFGSPHGGGGPGAGPICIKERDVLPEKGVKLSDLLPGFIVKYDEKTGRYYLKYPGPYSIGMVKAFFGNVVPLLWGFTYILSLGPQGLKEVTEQAVLNTNYFTKLLKGTKGYDLPYGPERFRKHEVVFSAEPMAHDVGVTAEDVAKGLLDAGFYAPTIYFPLIVHEALMIEFTDTETKENLERYAARMKEIAEIAYKNPKEPKKWPVNTAKGRIDTVKASHPKTVTPTWRVHVLRKTGKLKVLK